MCQNVFIEIGISLLEWSLGHTSYSLKLLLRGPNLALSFLGHSHSMWRFLGWGLNPPAAAIQATTLTMLDPYSAAPQGDSEILAVFPCCTVHPGAYLTPSSLNLPFPTPRMSLSLLVTTHFFSVSLSWLLFCSIH